MRLFSKHIITVIAIALLIMPACDENEPIDTDCSSTVLSAPDNRNIYLKLKLSNSKLHGNEDALYDASVIEVNGSVSLISCEGSTGPSLSFTPDFDSAMIGSVPFQNGIFLDEFQLFSFVNSRDYLLVLMKLNVLFPGGRKYVSDEIAIRYTYSQLETDSLSGISYIPLVLPTSVHWYLQSGK